MAAQAESTEAETFKKGDKVYFRQGQGEHAGTQEHVKKYIAQFGIGPHTIVRVDKNPSFGIGLKFRGLISAGLGEDAPSPCMRDEQVWSHRYFTKTPPTQ